MLQSEASLFNEIEARTLSGRTTTIVWGMGSLVTWMLNFGMRTARTDLASRSENCIPMQFRAPEPKGIHAKACLPAEFSGVKLHKGFKRGHVDGRMDVRVKIVEERKKRTERKERKRREEKERPIGIKSKRIVPDRFVGVNVLTRNEKLSLFVMCQSVVPTRSDAKERMKRGKETNTSRDHLTSKKDLLLVFSNKSGGRSGKTKSLFQHIQRVFHVVELFDRDQRIVGFRSSLSIDHRNERKRKKRAIVDDRFGEGVGRTQDLANLLLDLFEDFGIAREIIERPRKERGRRFVSRKLDQAKGGAKRKQSANIARERSRQRSSEAEERPRKGGLRREVHGKKKDRVHQALALPASSATGDRWCGLWDHEDAFG